MLSVSVYSVVKFDLAMRSTSPNGVVERSIESGRFSFASHFREQNKIVRAINKNAKCFIIKTKAEKESPFVLIGAFESI